MFPQYIVAAVRTVVRFVQTGLHQERQAAEERRNAQANAYTPQVGCVS